MPVPPLAMMMGRLFAGAFREGGRLAEQVGVELGPHIAAAAPGLVAHGEVVHAEGLVAAVLAAQLGQGGELPSAVMYSSHSAISCALPVPILPFT